MLNRGRMVGRGTYGTVYRAEVRLHGEHFWKYRGRINIDQYLSLGVVALKELNFVSPTPSQYQAFRNEVIALKYVSYLTFIVEKSSYPLPFPLGKLLIRIL